MHKKYAVLATCQLNQWAMSFNHNKNNIIKSIEIARQHGASYRLGPELEISGYGCEDHFFELDTVKHSWQVLKEILESRELTQNMICDIGMPVHHKNTLYNCRVLCLNQEILLIRPKLYLAAGNNYRENRWFTTWQKEQLEDFLLSPDIQAIKGQKKTKFGNGVVNCLDTEVACETCEELWVPKNPHVDYGLDGVEIVANSSGSHHELRKLYQRHSLIHNASARNGGVYLYSNLIGCDGSRVYYDGSSMIAMNGKIYKQGKQFTVNEVEVMIGVMDLDEVRSLRGANTSRNVQSSMQKQLPRVEANIQICRLTDLPLTKQQDLHYNTPNEEIAQGPALWMWDYLRRSGARGFFLPLSGGADSSATAALVASMCILVFNSIENGNQDALKDLRRIVKDETFIPQTWRDIVNEIFVTCYLSTKHSSKETTSRAQRVSEEINSLHYNLGIDEAYDSIYGLFKKATTKEPKYEAEGGTYNEDLALQNIQARVRMVMSYLMAQLVPWTQNQKGFLLVLGSSNIDEGLRGYMTKYDCSSADINPIGGINKSDLRKFLKWFSEKYNIPVFTEIAKADPTAELRPHSINGKQEQLDEVEMGFTYDELDELGRLRKIQKSGPVSMFERLLHEWPHFSPRQVADKVKKFFYYYSVNRHKMTVLTPSYHAENYGTDDNRYDHRQFLYDTKWEFQFAEIEKIVEEYESKGINHPITQTNVRKTSTNVANHVPPTNPKL